MARLTSLRQRFRTGMSGHPIYSDELLIQLGKLTIAHGMLEEMMARMISAFTNPDDPKAEFDKAFDLPAAKKRTELSRIFASRCQESGVNQQAEMDAALRLVKSATEARNDIVHGLISEEADKRFFIRFGQSRPVTVDEVEAVIMGLALADIEVLKPIAVVWNSTLGHFDQKPKPEGE